MDLRPSSTSPGRTYKWFTGTPVFEFGEGIHFTTFDVGFTGGNLGSVNIQSLLSNAKKTTKGPLDSAVFKTVSVNVHNTGKVKSDYVVLLFLSSTNAGPAPHPNKQLVSYTRVNSITPGQRKSVQLDISIGSVGRVAENGDLMLYPGDFELVIDTAGAKQGTGKFSLTGQAELVTAWPQRNSTSTA
jgi:xylan 1,4-beta-xylosidase